MVKRWRDQSQEQPSFLSWLMMMPPCLSFHSQIFSTSFSRPRSSRCLMAPSFLSAFSTCVLGGDAGVVGAGEPEHFLAQHAGAAGEDVLDGVVQHVAEVEHARDVRRRDDDGIRRTLLADAGRVGLERLVIEPALVPARLHLFRCVGLAQFGHRGVQDGKFWGVCKLRAGREERINTETQRHGGEKWCRDGVEQSLQF